MKIRLAVAFVGLAIAPFVLMVAVIVVNASLPLR
jgi:hypothetical protein